MSRSVPVYVYLAVCLCSWACQGSSQQSLFYTSWVERGHETGFFNGKGVRVLIPNYFSGEIVFSVSAHAQPLPSKNGVVLVDARKASKFKLPNLNQFQENVLGKAVAWLGFDVVTVGGNHLPIVEEAEVGLGYDYYMPTDGTLHLFVGTRKQYREQIVPKLVATPAAR